MIRERFGAQFGAVPSLQADLFEHNTEELAQSLALVDCYVGLPQRERCKPCAALPERPGLRHAPGSQHLVLRLRLSQSVSR
jgi:hypothetical protein